MKNTKENNSKEDKKQKEGKKELKKIIKLLKNALEDTEATKSFVSELEDYLSGDFPFNNSNLGRYGSAFNQLGFGRIKSPKKYSRETKRLNPAKFCRFVANRTLKLTGPANQYVNELLDTVEKQRLQYAGWEATDENLVLNYGLAIF